MFSAIAFITYSFSLRSFSRNATRCLFSAEVRHPRPFTPENALHCACSNYGWRGGWIELPTVVENQVNILGKVLHGFVFPTSQFLGKRQWDEYQAWDPESSCYLKRRRQGPPGCPDVTGYPGRDDASGRQLDPFPSSWSFINACPEVWCPLRFRPPACPVTSQRRQQYPCRCSGLSSSTGLGGIGATDDVSAFDVPSQPWAPNSLQGHIRTGGHQITNTSGRCCLLNRRPFLLRRFCGRRFW